MISDIAVATFLVLVVGLNVFAGVVGLRTDDVLLTVVGFGFAAVWFGVFCLVAKGAYDA